MDHIPGHERRKARRAHRQGRRLVRSGEDFTSEELERGEVELELEEREPNPEPPEDEQAEPWGAREDDPRFRDRLRLYKEFLLSRTGGGDGE